MDGLHVFAAGLVLLVCGTAYGLPHNHSSATTPQPHNSNLTDVAPCPMIILGPEEFVLYPNNTVYIPLYQQYLDEYHLEDGKLSICISSDSSYEEFYEENISDDVLTYTTIVGLAISIICLFIHMVLFVLLREMRTFHVCNLTSHAFCLIIAYSLFLCIDSYDKSPAACHIIAVLMHYFFLASFFWSNIISFDVLRSLINFRYYSVNSLKKRYIFYSIYSWICPLIISMVAILFNYTDLGPAHLKPEFASPLCWFQNKRSLFYFFGVPVIVILIVNFVYFIASIILIISKKIQSSDKKEHSIKKELAVYLRLAVIMGFAWIFGVVASFTNSKIFWYLFVCLTTFHGLFIFITFTCFNKVVRKNMRSFFCKSKKYDIDSSVSVVLHNR